MTEQGVLKSLERLSLQCMGCALVLALVACEDKPKETKSSDAGASPKAAVDPDLAEAVEAAGQKAKADGGVPVGDGPPEKGVFAPGKADLQLKAGEAPKIALGDSGVSPRTSLTSSIVPGWKQSGSLDVTLRLGRAQFPEISVALALEAPKPKAPAPAAPGAAPAPAAAPQTSGLGTPVNAQVTDVKLKSDAGAQGKDLARELVKLKGSRVGFQVVAGGVATDFTQELAKGAPVDLELVLRAVSEALESSAVGFPKEEVGVGGYWLVTTRGIVGGAEVISYRLVKLEKMDGDQLTLSVNTKRYAVSQKLALVGLPPGAELDQFQSTTDGKLTLQKGDPLASGGSTKQTFLAALTPAGGGDQRLAVQSVADVTIAFGKK